MTEAEHGALPWVSGLPAHGIPGPRIALIHGLFAGSHMQRNLLRFLREAGHADSSLYSNHLPPARIADSLAEAATAGRPVVLIGYSQGGFQAIKVARLLARRGIPVALLVTAASGGKGRWWPPQWALHDVRSIPDNVRLCLNFFSLGDTLGSDRRAADNQARGAAGTRVENHAYPLSSGVDHIGIVRCYPESRVIPQVRLHFLDRLLAELRLLSSPPPG